jgi:hypothetical protein
VWGVYAYFLKQQVKCSLQRPFYSLLILYTLRPFRLSSDTHEPISYISFLQHIARLTSHSYHAFFPFPLSFSSSSKIKFSISLSAIQTLTLSITFPSSSSPAITSPRLCTLSPLR